jgi:hypothetical protein
MKKFKILNIGAAICFLFALSSCDQEDGRVTFGGPYYVQFTTSAQSVSEAAGSVVAIQVSNVGPTVSEDIIITYETTGSVAVEGVDYELEAGQTSGQIVIPAGRHFGELRFIPTDNDDSDGSRSLIFTLTGASSNLEAGSGAIGVTYTVTLTDDDCPLDLETIPGAYDHDFVHTAGFLWNAGAQSGFVATLATTDVANVFSCTNFFGIVDRFAAGALPGEPGIIPIQINVVEKTAQVLAGDHILYGTTGPRDIRGTGTGPVETCGPNFSLSADLVRRIEQTVGTSILVANFNKVN